MSKQHKKKRYSVGSRVLAGIVCMQPGTVQSVADKPGILGEFVYEVLIDGELAPREFLGSELQPQHDVDEDLRSPVYIQNSNVANLNLGSQVGTINAALQTISTGNTEQKAFAQALEQLTQAVRAEIALQDEDKLEVMDALSTIAEQAAKPPYPLQKILQSYGKL
jgi:hypothetical protein